MLRYTSVYTPKHRYLLYLTNFDSANMCMQTRLALLGHGRAKIALYERAALLIAADKAYATAARTPDAVVAMTGHHI